MSTHAIQTVTAGKFGVSVDTGSYFEGAVLHVYRFERGKHLRGEGDGMHFPTREAAWAWAEAHGHSEPYRRRVWCTKHRCLHTSSGRPSPTFGECYR